MILILSVERRLNDLEKFCGLAWVLVSVFRALLVGVDIVSNHRVRRRKVFRTASLRIGGGGRLELRNGPLESRGGTTVLLCAERLGRLRWSQLRVISDNRRTAWKKIETQFSDTLKDLTQRR